MPKIRFFKPVDMFGVPFRAPEFATSEFRGGAGTYETEFASASAKVEINGRGEIVEFLVFNDGKRVFKASDLDPDLDIVRTNFLSEVYLDGDDVLIGSRKDDVLVDHGGSDRIVGKGGNDTLDYSRLDSGVKIALGKKGFQDTGAAGRDRISGVENVIGTEFADRIKGDKKDNVLHGFGGGGDTINGGKGDDTIWSGPNTAFPNGPDMVRGGSGADTFLFRTLSDFEQTMDVDVIADFEPGVDRIDLSGWSLGGLGLEPGTTFQKKAVVEVAFGEARPAVGEFEANALLIQEFRDADGETFLQITGGFRPSFDAAGDPVGTFNEPTLFINLEGVSLDDFDRSVDLIL
jgi:Ca2+-binding RTX toxin-like protein